MLRIIVEEYMSKNIHFLLKVHQSTRISGVFVLKAVVRTNELNENGLNDLRFKNVNAGIVSSRVDNNFLVEKYMSKNIDKHIQLTDFHLSTHSS